MAVEWITPEELPAMWETAEGIDEDVLEGMLEAARDACEAWAPAEDDPERPGDRMMRPPRGGVPATGHNAPDEAA